MNNYKLKDLSIGMCESFQVEITQEKMDLFYKLTNDNSPIHMDNDYAKNRGFDSKVCYGMLQASFFSTLAGVYMPGENCVLHQVDAKFTKPVYIGDVLTIKGEIIEINETFNVITIKGFITNQNGKKVCRATIQAGVVK